MNPFSALYNKLYVYFNPHWDFTVTESIRRFRGYLNGNPVIRMWVDGAEGTGHQSSTVGILRQLSARVVNNGYGYSGTIEVYYEPGKGGDPTLPKLQAMLPELQGGTTGTVGLAQVTLIQWVSGTVPALRVNLGFTGGADNVGTAAPDFAGRLNLQWFLRLQPYLWPGPEQIQFLNAPTAPITLTQQKILGYRSFQQRAYYIQTPIPEPIWADYAGGPFQVQASIIQLLTSPAIAGVGVAPNYSIRSTNSMQLPRPAYERMFEIVTGVLASQRGTGSLGKSMVIFSCDVFGDATDQAGLTGLIAGGNTETEDSRDRQLALGMGGSFDDQPLTAKDRAAIQNLLKGRQYRLTWLTSVDAQNRVRYVWNATLATIQNEMAWLTGANDRVLFVQLGRIALPLFQWLMEKTAWPSVFEGQSTATVALNIANPYFHLTRTANATTQYPTTVLGYEEFIHVETGADSVPFVSVPQVPRQIQDAADQLLIPVTYWSGVTAENPAESVGAFVRGYNAENPATGPLHGYFQSVANFYKNVNNDKLRVGTSFLHYILRGQGLIPAAFAAALAADDGADASAVLTALLAALQQNQSPDGTLRVAPGAFSEGTIFSFYTGFLGTNPGLLLKNSTITPRQENGDLVAIAVTGSTSFFDVPLGAAIVFTAPENIVIADARYTYDQKWTLDEIPWIGFSAPFMEFSTVDAETPFSASIGGMLDGAGVELAFQLPVAEGKWQLAGTFVEPYPSIARFYALAGGVNLQSALPAPFNALAAFGMQNARLVFDIDAAEVEYVAFRFLTADSFRLLGNITVENIQVDVTVQQPTSRDRGIDWVVAGTFRLGATPDAAIIGLGASGPVLTLRGDLLSGVLTLSAIIEAFCPSVVLNPPSEPQITNFQMYITPSTGNYQVLCNLNIDWPIVIAGTQIFSIDGLELMAEQLTGMVTGSLIGYVTVGSGDNAVPLQLSGLYSSIGGWTFGVAQTADSVIKLAALFNQFLPSDWKIVGDDYGITGLGMTVVVNTSAWTFTGRTAEPWTVPFIDGLSVSASLQLGWDKAYSARIDTEWIWQSIRIRIYFDYAPTKQTYGIIWGALEGSVTGPAPNGDWVASLSFGKTVTLGSIVEIMVSWVTGSTYALEAPWSVLNDIPLSGLALTYTFNRTDPTRNQVGFKIGIGPIDLGFARIDSINVLYNSQAAEKVAVTLQGSFPWNAGDGASGNTGSLGPWDAAQPGAAPTPPGMGNRYLDLRLLALGQHVTITGLTEANTVQKAIERMSDMKDPVPGKIPDVTFDPASAWLIGADFGVLRFDDSKPATQPGALIRRPNTLPVLAAPPPAKSGYLLTMQVVFNDPYLYGLRLALAGDAAKVFKGLDFQIMYRQVSETVGVYQAEITLPDIMRRLSIGAYTITLPVFGIAVYTNGDFQVDVGFPWNQDFTRSFTIEAIIPPGIPVIGSAGFYFGKLSSASTDKVPKATNGTFNPVLVFGIGMQVGFGKSIEYGILKAGFSITVVGILEGVLAKFNRYIGDGSSGGNNSQLQGDYYFWLRGTFGIVGRLYGSIDFAIIKADVNVTLQLLLQITYESYVSMTISVIVSVDVSVSIKINLGLFSIRISFSFSMRIKETFTIDNRGNAPWITSGAPAPLPGFTAHSIDFRLRDFRLPAASFVGALGAADRWMRLLPSTSGTTPLSGYLAPALTAAHDERDATNDPAKSSACYVFLPLIDTIPETDGPVHDVVMATLGAGAGADTSFELLAKMVLRWAVAAGQSDDLTPEQVDGLVVKEADLSFLLNVVLVSKDDDPVPIAPEDIDSFMARQFRLTLSVPPQTVEGSASTTYFPIAPALQLTVPKYGDAYPGYDYVFGAYNELTDATLAELRSYFDDLAVQVKKELDSNALRAEAGAAGAPLSMATWVLSDYFLLLTRQMVQAALDALRDFKYVLAGQSAKAIVDDVNATGELPPGDDHYTVPKLFAANPSHVLNSGNALTVGVTWPVASNDSFETLSVDDFRSAVTPLDIATANAVNSAILRGGAVVHYDGVPYTIVAGNTLVDLAWHFGVRLADFLSGAPELMTQTDLFNDGASMLIPLVTAQSLAGASFNSIAALPAYGGAFTATQLGMQNTGRSILRTGEKVKYPSKPDYVVQANDTLADVAQAFEVTLPLLFANSDVLAQTRLLIDVAVIVFPPFGYTTAANDTLQKVATRYAVSLEVLGLQAANGLIAGLFAVVDESSQPAPFLDVPHLVQYRVSEIIAETQRALAIRQLSRLVARYSMHGLRLPTTGIVPKARGIWVGGTEPDFTLPPRAGLYALTGQEIDLPALDAATGSFTMKVVRNGGPEWLLFAAGGDELSITIAPDSDDAARITKVRDAARGGPLAVPLDSLGADAMYESRLASYPLTTVYTWQTPSAVTLPYGPPPPAGQVPALRFWELPDALINLPDPKTPGKIMPRFSLNLATYDEATGGTVATPITSYGWTTLLTFTIKRVPPLATSPATITTYEIAGAGGSDVVLLERIVAEVGANDGAFANVILGYAPDATNGAPKGVQTDALSGITMGIAQVNLSTETRPPSGGPLFARALADVATPLGLLNTSSDFIRLLWEASITRAGGFYLYYYDSVSGRGLPDRIFNDRNEADVSLIVLWSAEATPEVQNRITDYMNAAATGDSIDTARSVVFAEASPMDAPVPATAAISLDLLAGQTYSNVADLAADNAQLRLAGAVQIVVDEGTFQAPPGGIALQQIVTNFGLQSIAQLNAANPRWNNGLPDPLPYPAAIFLPVIDLTAGTSQHTASLADVSGYYGENLTALAARNAATPGIFAAGQNIVISGGPRHRHATVSPGVEGVTATRPIPPPVPDKPGDPGYASAFLLNNFSMLNYQVAANVFFRNSDMGLPAGPTLAGNAGGSGSLDKVRVARDAGADDEWEYKQAFPYPKFALTAPTAASGLPPADGDPYRGVGSILQVDFYWQDYYGNTLVTNLTTSGNQPPMLTGYVDALLALSQWPSVSSAWKVSPAADVAKLDLVLTFDPTRYDGLISAKAASATSITATFTNELDPESANSAASYLLSGGPDISAASLGADQTTVTLTTSAPLTDGTTYVLAVNVTGKSSGDEDPPAYGGTATFHFPDDPALQTSSLRENARKDLNIYTSLYYQLNDGNGVALTVETSLLLAPVDFTAPQKSALLDWLFNGGGATSIYAYIQNREAGLTTVALPPTPRTTSIDLPLPSLNPTQIYELSASLTIRRTGGNVLGNLQTTPGIRSATTLIVPLVNDLDSAEPTATLGLTAFARDFEAALSVPGSHLMKVAGGIDRDIVSSVRDGSTLWAVRLGLDGTTQPIAYSVDNAGNPSLFAPQPISNELQSRSGIPIFDYKTGVGISPEPTRFVDFVDIDMDVWGLTLFTSVDETLTPEFTGPAQIVASRGGGAVDYLQEILDQKKKLAAAASLWMIPLYAGETADPKYVRAAFYEQLLSRLANAYATRAAIQFAATVNAEIGDPLATQPPRLFGSIIDNATAGDARSEITLTSPKLDLKTASGVPLPFLLLASDNVREDGAIVGKIDLDLTYDATHIEHQISSVPGIAGYVASSWLGFIIPGDTRPLTRPLGAFPVPMVLRAFPTNPTMVAQAGDQTKPQGALLSDLTEWTYSFVFSLPFHYPQDRVYCEVEFNINEKSLALFAFVDAFPQLAEFVTVYPSVQRDLVGILATIDATTDDGTTIDNAAVALASYIDLLQRITGVVDAAGGNLLVSVPPSPVGGTGASYSFHIEEGTIELDDPKDPATKVAALLVTIVGPPPEGIGTPVVLIDPTRYRAILDTTPIAGAFRYYYLDPVANEYLLAAEGQTIADRTVALPGMDILQRQDAWSTIYVKRNEELIPGKPTAEPFVYVTPDVQFSNPLFPTIDSSKAVDIASIGSTSPVVRPLPDQLTTLFNALFAEFTTGQNEEVTIQVETTYGYRLAPSLEPVQLPIFMQPPLSITVPPTEMIGAWSTAISTWFTAYVPSGTEGTLRFDLTIMSNLTIQPMPLLRLRNLLLRIADVIPPPPLPAS